MIKTSDFWDILCNKYNYRFFSGVPCFKLKALYCTINPNRMSFIHAIKSDIALGIVGGASFAGQKACLLIDDSQIDSIYNWLITFCIKQKLSFLIIVGTDSPENVLSKAPLPYIILDNDLETCLDNLSTDSPTFLFIKEGTLK
jgi:sulfopyruvate decarboxylase TPP-binding subunit